MDYEDVTATYSAYRRARLEDLDRALLNPLVIGDLIRNPDGRILIPADPVEANLFALYAGVRDADDSLTYVIGECASLADAEDQLDAWEAQGWPVMRWTDVFGFASKIPA